MKGYILNDQYATISIENLKSILGDALYHQFAIGTLKYGYRTGEKGERPVFVYSIPMECLSRERGWPSTPAQRKRKQAAVSLGRILKFQNLTCSLHLVLRKFKRNQICVSIINLQKMFCTSHAYGNTQDYTHYIVFMSTILCGTTKGSGYVRIAVKATLQMPKAV